MGEPVLSLQGSEMKFVLLAFCCVAAVAALSPEVYVVYTDFGPIQEQTIVVSGKVNLEDGTVKKQNQLFSYLGSSGTFDGISAYDQKEGALYYVNDFANAYIWGTRTTAPFDILPPTFLEDNGIVALNFDWKQRRLLVVDVVKQTGQNRLVLFPVDNQALGPKVIDIPAEIRPGIGAYDAERDVYYNYASDPTNSTLTVLDLKSLNVTKTLTVGCTLDKLFVENSHPDFTSRLWGIHANFTGGLHYDIANINLDTGVCSLIPLPTSKDGIMTVSAFDPFNGVLFYADVSDSGQVLRTTNVRDGHNTELAIKSSLGFSDMAVRFV